MVLPFACGTSSFLFTFFAQHINRSLGHIIVTVVLNLDILARLVLALRSLDEHIDKRLVFRLRKERFKLPRNVHEMSRLHQGTSIQLALAINVRTL